MFLAYASKHQSKVLVCESLFGNKLDSDVVFSRTKSKIMCINHYVNEITVLYLWNMHDFELLFTYQTQL